MVKEKKKSKNFFSNDKKFKDLKIGTKFGFERNINFHDVQKYAKLVRDKNPLHFKKKSTNIKRVMSHGMFVGSLAAALLGTYCPIKNNILVSISLNFKKPVFTDNKIRVQGTILRKSEALKILTVKISIYKKKITFVDGEAIIKVLR